MNVGEPLPWRRLCNDVPADRELYFGYYDRCPWDAARDYHLALQAPLLDRLPAGGETATVGVVEAATGQFLPMAETRAWCHQQGAMTLWLPTEAHRFVFNDYDVEADRLLARIWDVHDGDVGHYSRPLYTISADGRWGASLDFARIPRRGYSYADAPLALEPPSLATDGIWLVDLESGESRLLASYGQILAEHPMRWTTTGRHIWLNHVAFNADSQRLLFLCRDCPIDDLGGKWRTHMYTCDLTGDDLCCVLPDVFWRHGAISHHIWGRTPREILVDADWAGGGHDYVVFNEYLRPPRAELISHGLGPAGHLMFSPDGEWLVSDTYPRQGDGVQTIGLTRVATGETRIIGQFQHPPLDSQPSDLRCDLHPRWTADSQLISVDSVHEGKRAIYCLDINSATWELAPRMDSAGTG